MHNGQIGGYAQLRRTLEARLPDALYAERCGATDSELLFLLALARIHAGATAADAVLAVVDDTLELMQQEGITQPLRFAAVLSDGEQLVAFRVASDAQPPTLYLRQTRMGTTVASEPLCDGAGEGADTASGWSMLPAGAVVTVNAGQCRLQLHAPRQRTAPLPAAPALAPA
jgi:glutamine amidotransferase